MMKWIPLTVLCSLAFLGGACQRQPLPGQEPMHAHGTDEHHGEAAGSHDKAEHDEGKTAADHAGETKESEKPVEPAGAEEAPSFFPEKK